MSRRLALLIGNARYQDGRLHVPVPGKTFTALVDALDDPRRAHFDELFVLLNKPAVEIQVAIAEFLELSRSPDDFLFLYFTGHALYHQKRPYLACWDTFTGSYLDATTIQAEYIRRRLSLHPAKQKLVILDCTVSPLLADDGLPANAAWLQQAFQATGTHVLAAARPYSDDGSSPTASPLTPALIDGVQTGHIRFTAADAPQLVSQLTAVAMPPIVEPAAPTAVEPTPTEPTAPEPEPVLPPAEPETESTAVEPAMVETVPEPPEETAVAEPNAAPTAADPAPDLVAEPETAVVAAAEVDEPEPLTPELNPSVPLLMLPEVEPVSVADEAPLNEERQSALVKRWLLPLAALLFLLALVVWYGPTLWANTTAPALPTQVVAAVLPTDEPSPTAVVPTQTATISLAATETATTTPIPQATERSSATPRPSRTPSPTAESTAVVGGHVVRQLIYMREGPATNYRIIEYLTEGTRIAVLGRTESGDWYNVQLEDGRTGWVFSQMVEAVTEDAAEIELVATIPRPQNEFYDLVARPSADELLVQIGHVYVGTHGPEGLFTAVLLPETTIVQPTYENGQALGLGEFVVRFARVGEGAYTSTTLKVCMVSMAGLEFFCETYPALKEW